MMAMKMIDQAHIRKGKVRSFTSYCGGLPSPAAANNPLAYKFRYFNRLEAIKIVRLFSFLTLLTSKDFLEFPYGQLCLIEIV